MEEGRHTQSGNDAAQPAAKVVRLPRDWLGPHEELVPFGRQAAPPDGDAGLPEADSPPSPEDFWGERSAAVHDVVSAPTGGEAAIVGRPTGDEAAIVGSPGATSSRLRPRRRTLAAAAVVAVAVVVAVTIALLPSGSGHLSTAGARLDIASALRNGVSRILKIGPPRIISARRAVRPHVRRVQHVSHHLSPATTAPTAPQHRSSPPPAPTYAARTGATAASGYHPSINVATSSAGTSAPPPRPSPSSRAPASPTGESGALGPIHSPNG